MKAWQALAERAVKALELLARANENMLKVYMGEAISRAEHLKELRKQTTLMEVHTYMHRDLTTTLTLRERALMEGQYHAYETLPQTTPWCSYLITIDGKRYHCLGKLEDGIHQIT